MTQEKYWDSVAEEKTFTTPFQMSMFETYVSTESRILDVGCSYGRTLDELYTRGFRNLHGVDFSQRMIDRGKKLHPHLDLRKNAREQLPFDDNSFDAVLLLAVLTCIIEDMDQTIFLREIRRVLKDNGILYVNDFLINEDQRNVERYREYEDTYGTYGVFELPEGVVVRHHTKDHILEVTGDFQTVEFQSMIFITMNGNRSNGFYFIGRKKR